ncbi:hypothetical protein N9043_00285 [bacterium]|nr:hypothetical protein [bacterium]
MRLKMLNEVDDFEINNTINKLNVYNAEGHKFIDLDDMQKKWCEGTIYHNMGFLTGVITTLMALQEECDPNFVHKAASDLLEYTCEVEGVDLQKLLRKA